MTASKHNFSKTLITWQKEHGRHDMAWQIRDPYARWISEIMLQQTQVATVREYYDRFIARFPSVESLAAAKLDEVMQLWAGLGYYTRARNLHMAAQVIVSDWQGKFKHFRADWEALPGIGRSTAAAIVAFSFGAKETILDGNVKRVLMRYFAIQATTDDAAVVKKLWTLAESLLPNEDIEAYIQGLMDLGATVCTRVPACDKCPFNADCMALAIGKEREIPFPKMRRERPLKHAVFFLIWDDDAVFLQKRNQKGVWQGLFSLPQNDGECSADDCEDLVRSWGFDVRNTRELPDIAHDFSHYRLLMHPIAVRVRARTCKIDGQWFDAQELDLIGMPAPVQTLLTEFFAHSL